MNNKGQSLVAFVLLLPVISLMILALASYGDMLVTKNNYENSIKSALKYGLDNLDDPNIEVKLNNLLKNEISEAISININDQIIHVKLSTTFKNNFSKMFNKNEKINISYIGYIENGKKIIRKE